MPKNKLNQKLSLNIFYNLVGYILPLISGLLIIPILLRGIGEDKFGILNIAWIIIGYFGFFDLGIGRALTKIVAEKIGSNSHSNIPSYFWSSIIFILFFSSVISLILLLLADKIIFSFLIIPENLQEESLNAFYLLIISIPFVSTSAGMRGLFEAYQRFDIVNIIRVIFGIFSFVLPAIVIFFSKDLYWIIFSLLWLRIIIWLIYLAQSLKLNKELSRNISLDLGTIKQIFKLSSWMTISNITVPIIVYLDRILIASLVSSAAVSYYATPYEVITKILIIPSALTNVLFPTFAANYIRDPEGAIQLSMKAMKYIFLLLLPLIFVIVIFSNEFLNLWLGKEFALNSSFILQMLSLGILFNSIAYIPFSFIEGIGRPDVTAKIQLIELPFYLILMWYSVKHYGIKGASIVYLLRMAIDCLIMIYSSVRLSDRKVDLKKFNLNNFLFLLSLAISSFFILELELSIKILFSVFIIIIYIFYSWKFVLDSNDRNFLTKKLNILGL